MKQKKQVETEWCPTRMEFGAPSGTHNMEKISILVLHDRLEELLSFGKKV